jgi:hypothetical protein
MPCYINAVHALISHFLKIHLHNLHLTTPGFSKWSLFLSFSHQNHLYTSTLPLACYMPLPPHFFLFFHPNNTGWGENIKPLTMYFPQFPCNSSLLDPNIFLSTPFSITRTIRSSLKVSDQVSHTYRTNLLKLHIVTTHRIYSFGCTKPTAFDCEAKPRYCRWLHCCVFNGSLTHKWQLVMMKSGLHYTDIQSNKRDSHEIPMLLIKCLYTQSVC